MVQQLTSTPANTRSLAVSIGRGTFSGAVANFMRLATRLITVPIVIHYLGLDAYGIWSIIMTAASYMRFGTVGIKSAFQKYVAEATGNGNFEKTNRLLSTGTVGIFLLSVLGLIPVALFSQGLARLAGVPEQFRDATALSITLLAFIMVLSNTGAVFEAIVMGGHRIEIARNLATGFIVAEAVAIVILLRLGYGLVAMSAVMAVSEVGYRTFCFVASRRVLPQVQVRLKFVTTGVAKELVTFAGSYQLVNMLEVAYASIVPICILRIFGAEAAGVFAVATRLVGAAVLGQEALLLPVLSSGSMLYAAASVEKLRLLFRYSFKLTFLMTLLPLGFVCVFSSTIVKAWTGEVGPMFGISILWTSVAALFRAVSLLGLILYRVSGRSILDNVRQVLRIVILVLVSFLAIRLGFSGLLIGLAVAEFVGMVFMIFAIAHTFESFSIGSVVSDLSRLLVAASIPLGIAALAAHIRLPWESSSRFAAITQVMIGAAACLAVLWPALVYTRSISGDEITSLRKVVRS